MASRESQSLPDPTKSFQEPSKAYMQNLIRVINKNFQSTNLRILEIAEEESTVVVEDYQALVADQIILVNRTTGDVTVTLVQAASMKGRIIRIKATEATGNTLTVKAHGAELIDASNTVASTANYQNYTLYSNGVQWYNV